jgi:predicted DNA-binding transcriptional regulator YafY
MEATLDQTIRFCGKFQVLMEMTYNGFTRMVEPYSYRTTKMGDTLLFAYCYKDDKIESFRVDRIQNAKATKEVFTPRFAIEVT